MSHSRSLLIIPKLDGDRAIIKKCVVYCATSELYASQAFLTGNHRVIERSKFNSKNILD